MVVTTTTSVEAERGNKKGLLYDGISVGVFDSQCTFRVDYRTFIPSAPYTIPTALHSISTPSRGPKTLHPLMVIGIRPDTKMSGPGLNVAASTASKRLAGGRRACVLGILRRGQVMIALYRRVPSGSLIGDKANPPLWMPTTGRPCSFAVGFPNIGMARRRGWRSRRFHEVSQNPTGRCLAGLVSNPILRMGIQDVVTQSRFRIPTLSFNRGDTGPQDP